MRWLFFFMAFLPLTLWGKSFDPERDIPIRVSKGFILIQIPKEVHLKKSFMDLNLKPGSPGKLSIPQLPPTQGVDELGDPIWKGELRLPLKGEGLGDPVEMILTYQPCTEGHGGVCYPPTDRMLKVSRSEVLPQPTKDANAAPEAVLSSPPPAPSNPTVSPSLPEPMESPSRLPETSQKQALPWLLLLAFLWGTAASLTPCVYPMIPITMAIVGAKGGGWRKGLGLSLALVLGMSVTYSSLGVVVALSGGVFGAFAQKAGFLVPLSLILAAFSLSLFGLFEIRLPAGLQNRLQSGNRSGWGGAFLMGLVLGPISAPCVGPLVGTILVSIAQQGQVLAGALQLFAFSMGMGVLFLAVGTFSAGLPRSGDWLTRLKQFLGCVVLGFAIWQLRHLLPAWANHGLWAVELGLAAVILGVFTPASDLWTGFQKAMGALALSLALLLGLRSVEMGLSLELLPRGSQPKPSKVSMAWIEQDFEGAQARARSEGKKILLDTYAEWCAQCKELDEKTWPDPDLQAWIHQHVVPVRIDTDKIRPDLAKRFKIQGYPTILLLDSDGKELRRILGFHPPKSLLPQLQFRGDRSAALEAVRTSLARVRGLYVPPDPRRECEPSPHSLPEGLNAYLQHTRP